MSIKYICRKICEPGDGTWHSFEFEKINTIDENFECPDHPGAVTRDLSVLETETVAITQEEQIHIIVDNASAFGLKLLKDFATENILMGITQAGKTGAVSMYLHNASHYLTTGSLYEAINEINSLISEGIPLELDPFVTETRLLEYKVYIQDYLS